MHVALQYQGHIVPREKVDDFLGVVDFPVRRALRLVVSTLGVGRDDRDPLRLDPGEGRIRTARAKGDGFR